MKKLINNIIVLLLGLTMNISLVLASENSHENSVFQVATIASLVQGVYDGDYKYGNLMKHGNFGVGTFLDLNGEMVAVDGNFYQIDSNGKVTNVHPEQIVPFAVVTYFNPTMHKNLNNIANYNDLKNILLNMFPNKNKPYAIRIDGTFKVLELRSPLKQMKPYPLLPQALKNQALFHLKNVKGSMVGFWFPKYWSGIEVPELHLHFITMDRTAGGHVLEADLITGQVNIQALDEVQVYLPNTKSFAAANLSVEELNSVLKKTEGGN
ncbi:MAG: acetolactate decarboxylase [Proteobacteria bacterium]|nr:acetolactate decarboxylase [Pseudomonadota bacterium]